MSPATTLDSFCRRVHSFTRALRMNIMARCQRGIGECACVCAQTMLSWKMPPARRSVKFLKMRRVRIELTTLGL